MKNLFLTAIISSAIALSAQATTILPGPETPLQDILNGVVSPTDLNVHTDQLLNDAYWTPLSDPAAYLIIEVAGYANSNSFGIFQLGSPANKQEIFSGPQGAGATVSVAIPWTSFGFYLSGPGGTFYSDPSLNAFSLDHLVAFQGIAGDTLSSQRFGVNDYVLAWEDLPDLGDQDYNDLVVLVQDVKPVSSVPDNGATLILLGLGLCGLAAAQRKLGLA